MSYRDAVQQKAPSHLVQGRRQHNFTNDASVVGVLARATMEKALANYDRLAKINFAGWKGARVPGPLQILKALRYTMGPALKHVVTINQVPHTRDYTLEFDSCASLGLAINKIVEIWNPVEQRRISKRIVHQSRKVTVVKLEGLQSSVMEVNVKTPFESAQSNVMNVEVQRFRGDVYGHIRTGRQFVYVSHDCTWVAPTSVTIEVLPGQSEQFECLYAGYELVPSSSTQSTEQQGKAREKKTSLTESTTEQQGKAREKKTSPTLSSEQPSAEQPTAEASAEAPQQTVAIVVQETTSVAQEATADTQEVSVAPVSTVPIVAQEATSLVQETSADTQEVSVGSEETTTTTPTTESTTEQGEAREKKTIVEDAEQRSAREKKTTPQPSEEEDFWRSLPMTAEERETLFGEVATPVTPATTRLARKVMHEKVLFVGDSHAKWWPKAPGYKRWFDNPMNIAESGYTTQDTIERIERLDVNPTAVSHVVVSAGTNDCYQKHSDAVENLRLIVEKLQDKINAPRIFMVAIPPRKISKHGSIIDPISEEKEVEKKKAYEGWRSWLQAGMDKLQSEGVIDGIVRPTYNERKEEFYLSPRDFVHHSNFFNDKIVLSEVHRIISTFV